ncbi:type II secretion system protein [Patescibacteria group bacterium]|nr:type II secretion system protein [Patescibacteria group bacterium]
MLQTKKVIQDYKGFTLVELLVVITIVGILAGVVMKTVNVQRQKDISQDGVNKKTMIDLAQGIQAYRIAEGLLPQEVSGEPSADNLDIYLNDWPNGFAYFVSGTEFMISVGSETESSEYYVYSSTAGKVVRCSSPDCSEGVITPVPPLCVDTDGGDYSTEQYVSGYVYYGDNPDVHIHTDRCVNSNRLRESYCNSNEPATRRIHCSGSCVHNACEIGGPVPY